MHYSPTHPRKKGARPCDAFILQEQIYKDLIKYPRSIFGVGTVPIFLSFIPVFIARLISIIISLNWSVSGEVYVNILL